MERQISIYPCWCNKQKHIESGVGGNRLFFKVATQEDSYGDPICDGSLAKNTIDFDKGQFKAIILDAIEKSKDDDE